MTTPKQPPAGAPRFCSQCGGRLNAGAKFCQDCGSPVNGGTPRAGAPAGSAGPSAMRWAVPTLAILAVVVLSAVTLASRDEQPVATTPLGGGAMGGGAPDISSMSPTERADRLFNRVMLLSTQGKTDSAAFFAPMAIASIQALAPLDAHRRYDLGLVHLAAGDAVAAGAQADSILAARGTHLLGLTLAARAAEARGANDEAASYWKRLVAAETDEIATGLQEYVDHDADIRAAVTEARER